MTAHPKRIVARRLGREDFAQFGDIIEASHPSPRLINQGLCERHHDLACLDFAPAGRAGLSMFRAVPRQLPYRLELLERHPRGSQAFIPLHSDPFLVIVATDQGGVPGEPQAFITGPGQAINIHRAVWHGVLTPLGKNGLFAVLDWIGDAANLEEYQLPDPPIICSA